MNDAPAPSRDSDAAEPSLDSVILRLLMDNSPDRIYFKDLRGRIVRNNVGHADMLGAVSPEECVGKTDFDFFSPEHAEQALADEREIIRTGRAVVGKIERITMRDGAKAWVSTTKLPWRDAAGGIVGTFGVTRDVTAEKDAEEQLVAERNLLRVTIEEARKTAAELARSNAELEQFAYVASHDLQEPLRAVASCVQLLKKRYEGKLDARADEFVAHAVDGTKRMQALITDLLAYSRVGTHAHAFETVEGDAVLDEALANLTIAVAESGAVLKREPLPTVTADGSQFVQVFQNLISNAIKFRGDHPPEIAIAARAGEGEWIFSVADNGIGIEPQYFERVFRVFQRLHTRARYPGTGIGLAICKKIVERHGGRIWIESEPNRGARFFFTLPHHPQTPIPT
ncbi:MAG TPA: ATP-binding protein [Opitutus sp.]|nr:ATP-binding protein [Opitutus sp.]